MRVARPIGFTKANIDLSNVPIFLFLVVISGLLVFCVAGLLE